MITSLSLQNWKSHSSSSFSFGRGTNILIGRMGAGKSSVLDALCFALYGTFPKMSRRDQTVETVVNIASGAEHAEITLCFERGGKKYGVVRRIGKKISEAEVSCDGKLAQKGQKPVTDYITEALGVDYELFTRAIYSEQNRMDQILSLSPRGRKQEIDWLLGLGEFDTAREGAQSAAGKLSEHAEILRREADPKKIEEARQRLAKHRKEEAEKKEACESLGKRHGDLLGRGKESAAELANLEKTRTTHRKMKSECDLLTGASSRLARETEGKVRVSQVEMDKLESDGKANAEKLFEARALAKKWNDARSAAKSEIAVLQNTKRLALERAKRMAELEARALELTGGRSVNSLEEDIARLKSESERIAAERALFTAEAAELDEAVAKLSSSTAKCPVCDSDLSHGKSEALSVAKRKASHERRKAAEGHAATLLEGRGIIAALEKNLAEIRLCASQLERLKQESVESGGVEAKLIEAAEALEKAEESAKDAEDKIALLEKDGEAARKRLEEAKRCSKLFSDYDSARERLKSAEEALASLFFDEAGYEAFRKGHEALTVECASAKAALSGEEKQLRLVSELCFTVAAELLAMERMSALAAKYASAAESMSIYKNSLSAAQSELRATLVEEINEALLEIWPSIYPYSDYGSVKLEADEKDYRLLMQKDGWKEVDAIASGGERACLCLALRVAFATVLTPDVGWLILDEPTHNLDSDAVALLSQAINDKIPSIVEQTFVITHEPELGETAEGKVFRLERDKSTGEPTKVEPPS